MLQWLYERFANLFQDGLFAFNNQHELMTNYRIRVQKTSQEIEIEQEAIARMIRYGLGKGISRNKNSLAEKTLKIKQHFLDDDIVEKAKRYIDNVARFRYELPRPVTGKTEVFLPEDLPIVLKNSKLPNNKIRARKMRQALEMCEQFELDCLIIPQYRIYKGFILEQRLPIPKNCFHVQKEVYAENHEAFKRAAAQLTVFLFRSSTGDIFSLDQHLFQDYGPAGRYDNFPLYIEDGVGKVGLIDLEHFNVAPPGRTLTIQGVLSRAKSAIALFPYHLNEILTAARKISSLVDEPAILKNLETFTRGVQRLYQVSYKDYRAFLEQNEIDPEHPDKMVSLTLQRKEAIKATIIEFILNLEPKSRFFDKNDKEKLLRFFTNNRQAFEEAISETIDLTVSYPQDYLKSLLENHREPISSYGELMTQRTLLFQKNEKSRCELHDVIADKFGLPLEFSRIVTKAIYTEMAKGGEMSCYIPDYQHTEYFQI